MLQKIRLTIFQRWVDRLFATNDADLEGVPAIAIRFLRVHYLAYREFLRKLCWERAGTLAFGTILSLIPLTVLFLSFVGIVWTDDGLQGFIRDRVLGFLVPDETMREGIWTILETEIKTTAFRFQTSVSILALLGLVIASVALLVIAERVFNRLWEVSVSRNYFQKLRIFWLILTTSPVALGVSFYLDQLTSSGTVLGSLKDEYWLLDTLYTLFLPALISFVAFTFLNLFLPNTRVRLLPAMKGGLVTAILWELAKHGFYLYVQNAQNVSRFYGSLGLLPVFLVWIYLTWLLILFGAVVTYSAQNLRQLSHLPLGGKDVAAPPPSPFLAVYILERIFGAFESGRAPPSLEEIAESLDTRPEVLEPVVQNLLAGRILIEDRECPGRYSPGRSPALVRIREVVEGFPRETYHEIDLLPIRAAASGERRVQELFQGARGAFLGFLGDRTIEDVLIKSSDSEN